MGGRNRSKVPSFNPLPLPKQGEIWKRRIDLCFHKSFNPLPLPKQGEIEARAGIDGERAMFQSAPLTEARGDFVLPLYQIY